MLFVFHVVAVVAQLPAVSSPHDTKFAAVGFNLDVLAELLTFCSETVKLLADAVGVDSAEYC